MDDERISMKWEYKLGLVCDKVQSILSIQRMLVSVQTSKFQQWTEESKKELESSFWWNSQKSLISSMDNEDACGYKKVSGSIIIFLKTVCAWHIVDLK